MSDLKQISKSKCFSGYNEVYEYTSRVLGNTKTKFSVYIPEIKLKKNNNKLPLIYFLSGLTCTHENFIQKSGVQRYASKYKIALICPDTSPRGIDIQGDSDHWDFGKGAGFYINATEDKWKKYYNMYDFIVNELPNVIQSSNIPVDINNASICGHSMGGHGSLMIYLKNINKCKSVSAFAPVCNPINSKWGIKAFTNYLGNNNKDLWKSYDSTELINNLNNNDNNNNIQIFIDQGTNDTFLKHGNDNHNQLKCDIFKETCIKNGINCILRKQNGYGHGYDFISTFIEDHITYHASYLYPGTGSINKIENLLNYIDDIESKLDEYEDDTKNEENIKPIKFETEGKPIKCKAAIAWHKWDEKSLNPLKIETITVDIPKENEVRIKLLCTGVCHTDWYTLSGKDPEGIFPCILGHEGCGIIESIGKNVKSVNVGDVVIPLYIPECKKCKFCKSGKTNLCQAVRSTQGKGLMPDNTSRFTYNDTQQLFHFMGTSTFSQYTVLPEISVAKINKNIISNKQEKEVCLLGCGVTTGIGAVRNTMKVKPGSIVCVFGLGGVGLSVIQGCKLVGAKQIIGIDINPIKKDIAFNMGATDFINPNDDKYKNKKLSDIIIEYTNGGVDYSFECVGNSNLMRNALECCHKGWGQSCIIGVAASGVEIKTRPFNLVVGRVWKGSAFGGTKGRTGVPKMVNEYLNGKIKIKEFITDVIPFSKINEAFQLMKQQEKLSIRTVVNLWE